MLIITYSTHNLCKPGRCGVFLHEASLPLEKKVYSYSLFSAYVSTHAVQVVFNMMLYREQYPRLLPRSVFKNQKKIVKSWVTVSRIFKSARACVRAFVRKTKQKKNGKTKLASSHPAYHPRTIALPNHGLHHARRHHPAADTTTDGHRQPRRTSSSSRSPPRDDAATANARCRRAEARRAWTDAGAGTPCHQ